MIVLDKNKLCFVCIPKNGTHTIYSLLTNCGGRRIGEYHEHKKRKIPKRYFVQRYRTVMVWRDPVERAISLYSDIVLREKQEKRKVTHPDSIKIHEYIYKNYSQFSEFINYLCTENDEISEYLFKNQNWWFERIKPDEIIVIDKLNEFLEEQTGLKPTIQHSSNSLMRDFHIMDDDITKIKEIWAPDDYRYVVG